MPDHGQTTFDPHLSVGLTRHPTSKKYLFVIVHGADQIMLRPSSAKYVAKELSSRLEVLSEQVAKKQDKEAG